MTTKKVKDEKQWIMDEKRVKQVKPLIEISYALVKVLIDSEFQPTLSPLCFPPEEGRTASVLDINYLYGKGATHCLILPEYFFRIYDSGDTTECLRIIIHELVHIALHHSDSVSKQVYDEQERKCDGLTKILLEKAILLLKKGFPQENK